MKEQILKLLADIKELDKKNQKEVALPENVYYLNDDDILCCERAGGVSRYPYDMDGMTLWVCSNGHIYANEGDLTIFKKDLPEDQIPTIDFWVGLSDDDKWIPVSITGATKPVIEAVDIVRYTAFSRRTAYYITEARDYIFAVRAHVTTGKDMNFTVYAMNKTSEDVKMYVAAYMAPVLMNTFRDSGWAHGVRFSRLYEDDSCVIKRNPDPGDHYLSNYAVITKKVLAKQAYTNESNTAENGFFGAIGRSIFNPASLREGTFIKRASATNGTDMAIYSDIVKFSLKGYDEIMVNYSIGIAHDQDTAEIMQKRITDMEELKADIRVQEELEQSNHDNWQIFFGPLADCGLNNVLFSRFLKNVQRQVSLCALGKNYAGEFLGVRDVFQQLNASYLWNREASRKQAVRALNFIMSNGRPPRQFSVPANDHVLPSFDIRQYIDQGVWIIESLHRYLSIIGDVSILNEECSYYEIIDEKKGQFRKSDCIDTVLGHLIRITDYLISNIDDRTDCLKILYGDWNDAVNGLGQTTDDQEFGTGVSVMASLQLYKALKEMKEILQLIGNYDDKCRELTKIRENIAKGLFAHALQEAGDRTHIVHGWGDKGSYYVGSLCDTDGQCRYSANPYSFWCICEMLSKEPGMKESVLKAFDALDSKYGIKTFEPFFPADMKGVGRIVTLPPGTAENGCTYIHATTFAIMALFMIGEPERAWQQIFKILPITHKSLNKTPFVMSNSYCYNEEWEMDGESGTDWYTGSGAVLIRCIFEYALGVQATLTGLRINLPHYLPANSVTMSVKIKESYVKFIYNNIGAGQRIYRVNGELAPTQTDQLSGYQVLFIENEALTEKLVIEITD